MSAERMLGTLLAALQDHRAAQDTARLFGASLSLLTTLINPFNISLLVKELVLSPAITSYDDDPERAQSLLSLIHSATLHVIQRGDQFHAAKSVSRAEHGQEAALSKRQWLNAVEHGIDLQEAPSRSALVLAGLSTALSSDIESHSGLAALENILVNAINRSVSTEIECLTTRVNVAVALGHAFSYLAPHHQVRLDCDALLPALLGVLLHNEHALGWVSVLPRVDQDLRHNQVRPLTWSAQSFSFARTSQISSSGLMRSLGPLSRVIAFVVENVKHANLIIPALDELVAWSTRLHDHWQHTLLSTLDATKEAAHFDHATLQNSLPVLWSLLKNSFFAIVVILGAVIGRVAVDKVLAPRSAHMAQQTLHTLGNLNFIFARLGRATFSQYSLACLTAIDILTCHPQAALDFVHSITPVHSGSIAHDELTRNQDLFFLHTAEHMTLALPAEVNTSILLATASPYLLYDGDPALLDLFEAAHSVTLAVFAAPQNWRDTSEQLPAYVDSLCSAFPTLLSARQFRLAFRNLVRIVSSPGPISVSQPELGATLLQILYDRASAQHEMSPKLLDSMKSNEALQTGPVPTTEQSVIVFALTDCLAFINADLLIDWLPLTAHAIRGVDGQAKEACRAHFWNVIFGNAMGSENALVCVSWWNMGGREATMGYGSMDMVKGAGDGMHDARL